MRSNQPGDCFGGGEHRKGTSMPQPDMRQLIGDDRVQFGVGQSVHQTGCDHYLPGAPGDGIRQGLFQLENHEVVAVSLLVEADPRLYPESSFGPAELDGAKRNRSGEEDRQACGDPTDDRVTREEVAIKRAARPETSNDGNRTHQ